MLHPLAYPISLLCPRSFCIKTHHTLYDILAHNSGNSPTMRFSQAARNMSTSRISYLVALLLVLVAFAHLMVATLTAPVGHGLALFTASNKGASSNEGYPALRFGTFGYCLQIIPETYSSSTTRTPDSCSPSSIGYDPDPALRPVALPASSNSARDASLTSAMILHPLSASLACLALVSIALPPHLRAPALPPFLSVLAAALALVGLVCDAVLFNSLRRRLENGIPASASTTTTRGHRTAATGSYDVGMWALVVGSVCLVLASVLLCARWWSTRGDGIPDAGERAGVDTEAEVEVEKHMPDRTSSSAAPPSELEPVNEIAAELSQGPGADRYELGGRERGGRAELAT
ncbi:pali-domain-containing protein [Hypoxylon sp. NC1633]|nr:pali-domain-containing protein [Hypoxylon sp. NC1633]